MRFGALSRLLFRRHRYPAVEQLPVDRAGADAATIEHARELAAKRCFDEARAICKRIIARDAEDEAPWLLLGRMYREEDNAVAAKSAFDRAIELCPDLAPAYFARGHMLKAERRFGGAIRDFERALELDPRMIAARINLGTVHYLTGDFERALDCARLALEVDPLNSVAQLNQGLMLRELGKTAQAEAAFRGAMAHHPADFDIRCGLALTLIDQARFAEAERQLATILATEPSHTEARWLLSIASLMQGRFREGWRYYDSRFERHDAWKRPYGFPQWDGSPHTGTVLVYAEQGLGDDMLFASCIPDVLARVAHCVIECEPRLVEIFRRSFPAATVHGSKYEDHPEWLETAAISAQIAAGSLPRLFRRDWTDFPRHRGYLQADTGKVSRWRTRLGALGPGMKVGIAWTGGAIKTRRRIRSLTLSDLLPLLEQPDMHFVSLQYVESAGAIEAMRADHGRQVHHWPEVTADYDETAALVTALDLVISVCTAVVHLTGALGKPVWVMAPSSPEWRYLQTGDRMPWYPTARIFRQQHAADWRPVIASVAAELAQLRRA